MQTLAVFLVVLASSLIWAQDGGDKKGPEPVNYCNYSPVEVTEYYQGGGDGSLNNPFRIWNGKQLFSMAKHPKAWSHHYIQCKDIDLASLYSNQYPYFVIAGDGKDKKVFNGTYNGNFKTISNFTYDTTGPFYTPQFYSAPVSGLVAILRDHNNQVGLFSKLSSKANVFNMRMVDPYIRIVGTLDNKIENVAVITGINEGKINNSSVIKNGKYGVDVEFGKNVAFVAGSSKDGLFQYIGVKGHLRALENVGGVIGLAEGKTDLRKVKGQVHLRINLENLQSLGGIVVYSFGSAVGRALDSFMGDGISLAGSVEAYTHTGGLIGTMLNKARLIRSRYKGRIKSSDEVGGIVGHMAGNTVISRTYYIGTIDSFLQGEFMGGFAGRISGEPDLVPKIDNSYAHANLIDSAGYIFRDRLGGFAGSSSFCEISNSYAFGSIYSQYGKDVGGFSGRSQHCVIKDSYNAVSIKVDNLVGSNSSLIGHMFGFFTSIYPNSNENLYYASENQCEPNCNINYAEDAGTNNQFFDENFDVYANWPGFWNFSIDFFPAL